MESNETHHIGMFAPKSAFINSSKKHFEKVALIDADKLKHLCAYDVNECLKRGLVREHSRLVGFIEQRLQEIFNHFSAAAYIFCFSGKSFDTFRAKVAVEKEYKGNRKNDPSYYEGKIEDMFTVVDYIQNLYPTLIFADLEADDILCFLQDDDTFIYSNDKDLNQIPGHHFCRERLDLKLISEEEAFRNLFYQMIVGDSTDCIPGLRGYGAAKAKEIIDTTPLKELPFKVLYTYMTIDGMTKGIDAFCETWNLVKLRMNRGKHFSSKYERAHQLLQTCKSQIKKG